MGAAGRIAFVPVVFVRMIPMVMRGLAVVARRT
jgi:hypothetical protein